MGRVGAPTLNPSTCISVTRRVTGVCGRGLVVISNENPWRSSGAMEA